MTSKKRQNHLDYYRQHGIAPVFYDLSSMESHLQRREALYNKLGALPFAFKGAKVLEVAAGTGQNSLYIAQLKPARLILLEPNAAAVYHIQSAYGSFKLPHTVPEVMTQTLQEFEPAESFDVVLCENWLGNSTQELSLLNKLGDFVAPGGVLVVTTVSPIGFVPNLLRRFLVPYLVSPGMEFEAKSAVLEQIFTSHLKTLDSMTRSTRDWVQDNMLNPAYFGLCLSIPKVIEQLRASFDVVGASPSFAEDWRWFKSLAGHDKNINQHILDEYWRKALNYLDHRQPSVPGKIDKAKRLEELSYQILASVEAHEDAHLAQRSTIHSAVTTMQELLKTFIAELEDELPSREALQEFLVMTNDISGDMAGKVSQMRHFNALFGRETSYLSLVRRSL